MDLFVTGPGFFLLFFCETFVRYDSLIDQRYIGPNYFLRWLHELRSSVIPQIHLFVHNSSWFIFNCLSEILTQRLNEYSGGICAVILAYERYVMVCNPLDKDSKLTDARRKLVYFLATFGILVTTVGEGIVRYLTYDFRCYSGFTFFKGDHFEHESRIISGTVTAVLFSLLPALFCLYYYFNASKALFGRDRKIGRNINLIVCFSAICIIWLLTLAMRYLAVLYQLIVLNYALRLEQYKYPILKNENIKYLLFNLSGISSAFNPFLILLAQTDHRKPFFKLWKRVRQFVRKSESE